MENRPRACEYKRGYSMLLFLFRRRHHGKIRDLPKHKNITQ